MVPVFPPDINLWLGYHWSKNSTFSSFFKILWIHLQFEVKSTPSPLLRLLKENQDNEERSKSTSPPVVSPTSSSIRSPPPFVEESSEMIGAGLPLLQRILMLKAKEEKAAKTARTGVGGAKSVTSQLFSGISLSKSKEECNYTKQLPIGKG